MFKFNLGDVVQETVTGFIGVIRARTEWSGGIISYGIRPLKLINGIPQDIIQLREDEIISNEHSTE